jgi:hypothetical protein
MFDSLSLHLAARTLRFADSDIHRLTNCCSQPLTGAQYVFEVRPRQDHRGVNLISDALPFGRLWYTKPDDAIGYAKFRSRSHDAVIRVYDEAGNVIETHEHAGEFKEP